MTLAHCNVNGICSKIPSLQDTLKLEDSTDIFLVTETHLTSEVSDAAISIPGYSLLRNDSKIHGVCAYIADHLQFDDVDVSFRNVISFRLSSLNVHVYVVYRPPSYSATDNEALLGFLQRSCIAKETILMGDFNLPSLIWSSPDNILRTASASDVRFLELFDLLGLTQWVTEPTFPRSGNILDLILTSESDRIGDVLVNPPPPGCDHCSIHCSYIFDIELQAQASSSHRLLWYRGKYEEINNILSDIDWDLEFRFLSAYEALLLLLNILQPLISRYIPCCKERKHHNSLPWKKNPPTSLKRRRAVAWAAFKQARSTFGRRAPEAQSSLKSFQAINKQLRSFALCSQIDYERSLLLKMKENPKLLHSYLRHKKCFRSSVGPLQLPSGGTTDDPRTMADSFAEAFADVFTTTSPQDPFPHQDCDAELEHVGVTLEEVKNVFSNLDVNSAMGPDGLHPFLLKACVSTLSYPFYKIFQLSLTEGSFPPPWKLSHVILIFKKGSLSDALNYRPVSLLSVPSKCLERFIFKELHNFLSENSILTEEQFGFRPGRSTDDQLLLTYNYISQHWDNGHIVDLVLCDFSKAFDTVNHAILLQKLRCLGIHGQILAWLQDFLTGRTMQVVVKNTLSAPKEVRSGVPQGSILGPVLFLIYVNHLASNLKCHYKIFADDLKMYMCISKSELDVQKFQSDINLLQATATSWGLRMNPKKCAVMRFQRRYHQVSKPEYYLNSELLPWARSHTDLGVMIDDSLKFHEHARAAARKAGGVAHSFLKATLCRDPDFMIHILCTHIRPVLEYASVVWNTGYIEDTRRLEAVQRLWTRHTKGLENMDYGERLNHLDLYSIKGRLLRADLIKCWKIFHGACPLKPTDFWNISADHRTRGNKFKIRVCRSQLDVRARFFSQRIMNDWNLLPDWVVGSTSIAEFKSSLAAVLGSRLYDYYT